ncbi:MAG: hypothetical protein MUC92_12820 [Fimbriimonadaceae bacterium]|jgi:hypothetical protein|nr:hypothetical protein [Fimbriimonadaceae bacterium]
MTAKEHNLALFDEVGFQLTQCFANWPEGTWDEKLNEHAFSGREMIAHLLECYEAFLAGSRGEKHEWGTYSAPTDNPAELLALLVSKRAEARAVIEATDSDEVLGLSGSYILLHDAYHVGQLATLRLHLGGWDPYSIYAGH